LPAALALADEIENLASQYGAALALGDVRLLDDEEMGRVLDKFRDYGSQGATDMGLEYGGSP
jgi:L-fuculose-phosphate aldolase